MIKVLDFGISKIQDLAPTGPELQLTASAMGSPLYMSPEQMRSARDVDARTDIWSIGVIMYELLTGSLPFRGDTVSEICVKAASFCPPPMRDLRPALPLELRSIILRCLEKNPDDRYANVAELATRLLPFAPRCARPSVERIGRIFAASGMADSIVCAPVSSEKVSAVSHIGPGATWGLTLPVSPLGRLGAVGFLVVLTFVMAGSVFWLVRRHARVETAAVTSPSALVLTTSAATPLPAPIDVYPLPSAELQAPQPTASPALPAVGSPRTQNSQNAPPRSAIGSAATRPQLRAPTQQSRSGSDAFSTPH